MKLAFPATVAEWLIHIESLHPKSIEMGLDRVQQVAHRLQLSIQATVITVGGTNGKGSTCAMLERIYHAAGYRVGCYTSPHLLQYQERVRLHGKVIEDTLLCAAFTAVEQARQATALTYFEMGTLAALWVFTQCALDVVILEVGLGGRLDAVNIIDADCSIVTNVDLDHMEFLGNTREAIGFEKAGIYRSQQIAICGDRHPPQSLLDVANQLGVRLARYGMDFHVTPESERALYRDTQGHISIDALKLLGDYQWNNAANVLYAVRQLQERLPVSTEIMLSAIRATEVTGRFHTWSREPDIILDVAHNPHAARALLSNLQHIRNNTTRIHAVFSMLADKDIAAVVQTLNPVIDHWYVAPIHHPRAAAVSSIAAAVESVVTAHQTLQRYTDLPSALRASQKKAAKNDKIIVFGSFFTVAAILALRTDTSLAAT